MSLLLQNRIRRNSRNRYGKRTERLITFSDGQKRKSEWVYDKYGRLTAMNDEGKTVSYAYDNQSRIAVRKADNIPVYYTYTRFGQLETKSLGSPFAFSGDSKPIAYIKYFYSPDGQITARDVNGNKQDYKYDLKGQLLAVVDSTGKAVEQYVYDAAGNILSKTIDGKVTTFKYDKANQLVSSADANGKVTNYDYDAAGRLTKEGDKSYAYGWLDKVMSVNEDGKLAASFDYGLDGQIASSFNAKTQRREDFTWDGLALIKRDSTNFVNESAITGGNPILAFGKDSSKVLFEDILGSSVGFVEDGKFNAINRTTFGESNSDNELNFFTGKPHVKELGYAFQLRTYRADQGKWQTQDPLGYPDGWNNLAYCNNSVTNSIDWRGADRLVPVTIYTTSENYSWYGGTILEYSEYIDELDCTYLDYLYDYTLQGTFYWPTTCTYNGKTYPTGQDLPTYAFSYGPPIEMVAYEDGELTAAEIALIFYQNEQAANSTVTSNFNSWKAGQQANAPHSQVISIRITE
ncbi:MAG: RHS repeat-associated core domain-containing protein [Lentisphaerota bacterium]